MNTDDRHPLCHYTYAVTEFQKVIILQRILDGVLSVQQTLSLAPAHHETDILQGGDAPVVGFVFNITPESFESEPADGFGGISTRNRQPLIADVDCEARHGVRRRGSGALV